MKRLCHYHLPNPHHSQTSRSPLLRVTFFSSAIKSHQWKSKTNVIITNPSLLVMESCTTMRELKQIQAHMTLNGLIADQFPASRVLAFCALAGAGDLRHARTLFASVESPNAFMWNTMIRAHSRVQRPELAFQFFVKMIRNGVELSDLSFVYTLKACEQNRSIFAGNSAFCLARKMGFEAYLLVRNGAVRFFAALGCLVSARKMFDESLERDVVTWTTMIDGYAKRGFADVALGVFESMLLSKDVEPNEVTAIAVLSACAAKGDAETGKRVYERFKSGNRSLNLVNAALDMFMKCGCFTEATDNFESIEMKDVFTWTSMVNGYAKLGDLNSAKKCFDEMPEKNAVTWNAMIAGYSQNNRPEQALKMFHDMANSGFDPTEHTLVCVLSSCGQLGRLGFGQQIRRRYIDNTSTILTNAFIDMYAKCGNIDEATSLFDSMSEKTLVSWNTMIAGSATHGRAKEAIGLFERMRKVGPKPDSITFVAVLSACSHGGLVVEGKECLASMKRDFGLEPREEHYACMVDLLGRVGLVGEAHHLIGTMPVKPSRSAWGALLSACRIHGNAELAELAARELFELDPSDSGVYVSLASALANEKRWNDVRSVRSAMREKGVKKSPGMSSIEIDGESHEFLVADETHPRSQEIYGVLNHVFMLSNMEDTNSDLFPTGEFDYAFYGDFVT